ncbi:MAG: SPFH domain-containing protein [Planctomycetota bacterium]|jgi:hypothetical protein
MVRLLLGVVLIFAAIVVWAVGQSRKGQLGPVKFYWAGALVMILVGLFLFLSTSFVIVGPNDVGHLTRIYLGKAMPPGQVIAIKGQKGPQAEILAPGFKFEFLLNVLYKVQMLPVTEIKPGFCGKMVAIDGAPLRDGQIFADEWAEDKFKNMLNADYFLENGGQQGPQLSVLKPGKYRLNRYLFNVDTSQRVTTVNAGFVGVVKSNIQQVPYDANEVSKLTSIDTSGLAARLVPKGYIGIWDAPLMPGQYYLNTDAFEVIPIDTRVQTWTYAGGFTRVYIDLNVTQDGQISETKREQVIPVPKTAADMAIIVRIEGWEIPLDIRVLVQVNPKDASYVVASVGGINEIRDKVLTPAIRSIVRNVTGSGERDEKGQLKRKVLDLIDKREELENECEIKIIPECKKARVSLKEVRFGDPFIVPAVMVPRLRQQLAEQLKKTFQQEQAAQEQRIETEKARAEADQQPDLIKAQIKDSAAEYLKSAMQKEGEGEKLRLLEVAEGQKAQTAILGQDRVLQLAMLNAILEAAKENPQIVKVPYILVQGSTGGLEGAAAILGASNLTSGLLGGKVAPEAQPPKPRKPNR